MNPEGEAPDTTEQQEDVTPEATENTTDTWSGPAREEWDTVVGGLHYLIQQSQKAEQEQPEEEVDYENMDAADLVQHYVDSRLSQLEPYVATAAKQAGEQRMNELFDQFEGDPEIGKFDRKLASKVAESLYTEGGDPVAAVKEAAKMVSGLSKRERQAALDEYKESLKRDQFSDPRVTGGGERTPLPAKSYDEVIARWSGQEDV